MELYFKVCGSSNLDSFLALTKLNYLDILKPKGIFILLFLHKFLVFLLQRIQLRKIATQNTVKLVKIESILFVPIILSFSKNLRCLNFPVREQCCQQKNSKNDQKFFESAKMKKIHNFFSHQKCLVTLFCACVSAKFKHLKFFENVKIIGTNNIDSILGIFECSTT